MFSACDVHLHHLGTTQCHHPQESAVYLCHQAPHLPELPAVTEAFVPLFLTVSSWRNPFKSSYRICLLAINALILFAWGCLHFLTWCSEEMSPVICIFLPLKIITPSGNAHSSTSSPSRFSLRLSLAEVYGESAVCFVLILFDVFWASGIRCLWLIFNSWASFSLSISYVLIFPSFPAKNPIC